jgi:hypothetical protein
MEDGGILGRSFVVLYSDGGGGAGKADDVASSRLYYFVQTKVPQCTATVKSTYYFSGTEYLLLMMFRNLCNES